MEVDFANDDLYRMETDAGFNAGFADEVVRLYRRRMQMIRAAADERDFYALKSLHYEKLRGQRKHQHSMKLNQQWRLIVEVRKSSPKNIVHVVGIEDYHS